MHNLSEEKGEPKQYRTKVPSTYEPNTLPLGQTGSQCFQWIYIYTYIYIYIYICIKLILVIALFYTGDFVHVYNTHSHTKSEPRSSEPAGTREDQRVIPLFEFT